MLIDKSRVCFLVGDGAGVGKGGIIAGLIFENFLNGRKKSVWVCVTTDLVFDALRDLQDVGVGDISIESISLITRFRRRKGLFCTYTALIGTSTRSRDESDSRLDQIVNWCGEDFDGLIVFDECHKAKFWFPPVQPHLQKVGLPSSSCSTIPNARILYASATAATEPKNMAYMSRLGIWCKGSPFCEFRDFLQTVEHRLLDAVD